MRRAAAGGEARAARQPGGAVGPGPASGRREGQGAGSAGPRPLPAQPRPRTRGRTRFGDPQATSLALSVAPDVFAMRVLLEDSEEMFRVTNCRSDMTVRELKEELDLMAGIPFNLQRLQFLDQGTQVTKPASQDLEPETPVLNGTPQPRTTLLVSGPQMEANCKSRGWAVGHQNPQFSSQPRPCRASSPEQACPRWDPKSPG
ncbi:uncharacterized protein [Vicugna pacos]|uniref:Ankyrin repeat domain-containing protein 40 n=1 Tax=Vicugna pacos TaxID=30538 RepID=A0ABM5BWE6_VICPA